jgi:hypothetical protein
VLQVLKARKVFKGFKAQQDRKDFKVTLVRKVP